jgi:hypothetical protein
MFSGVLLVFKDKIWIVWPLGTALQTLQKNRVLQVLLKGMVLKLSVNLGC